MSDSTTERPKGHNGFTLLEVMAAISIIAVVLVAVYQLHAQTISMSEAVRFYTVAPILAQSRIAGISAGISESRFSDSGDFGENYPGYAWSVTTEEIESEVLGNAAEDFKKIDVAVTYNEDEFTYHFRSYQMVPEPD
ncbi:MAG: type IV pilus modification PilV family protein [Thermodesulfobacteriota bacterium]